MKFEEGDIYKWSWNQEQLAYHKHQIQSGTLYWACSKIGIVDSRRHLVDTWSSCDPRWFTEEDVYNKLDVVYLGNLAELEKVDSSNRAYYLDEDCIDLNHPNSPSGNFYIKKGAKKNLDKMKKILARQIKIKQSKIAYEQRCLDGLMNDFYNISLDSCIWADKDVPTTDSSYLDSEEVK